jgi:hypothetical protein
MFMDNRDNKVNSFVNLKAGFNNVFCGLNRKYVLERFLKLKYNKL